jgi:hypothetical protein
MSQPADDLARNLIRDLLAGNPPPPGADAAGYGLWAEPIQILLKAYGDGGSAAVRQAWQILAKTDPTLVELYSAGGLSPLDGATAAVRRLLALDADTPIPNIDQARRLSDLADFVRQALTLPKLVSRNRKEAVAYAIRQLLLGSKRLLLDVGEDLRGRPYLAADDHALWPLSGDLAPVRVMLAESGLNVSEPAFAWLLADLEKAAYLQGARICLAHFATRRGATLYLSAGPGRLVKATLQDGRPVLRAMPNGADGVWFAGDTALPAWGPSPAPRPPSELPAFNPALTTPPNLPAYTPAIQRLLLDAWLIAVIADIRPAPLLAAIGQMDGGKTTLIRAVCKLILDAHPTSVSDDPRDLWALAAGLPLLGLDNVDREPPTWLPDFLAALVTGVSYDRRKLYSNLTLERRRARAVPLLSTRNAACVARPDVAQRTLPLLTGEFEDGRRQSDQKLLAEVEQNRAALLTWLAERAASLLPRLSQAPTLPSRFIDFAALVWAFEPDLAQPALAALQRAQALVVSEEDKLLAAIIEYADELLGELNYWHGRAGELVKALDRLGADLPYLGGGKAIAFKLREGRSTLALFGLSLTYEHKGNTSYFTLRKHLTTK